MTDRLTHRLALLRQAMHADDLEALLLTAPLNRRYISGFAGSNGQLVLTATAAYLITDFRYRLVAQQQAPACTLCETNADRRLHHILADLVQQEGIRRLAFEAEHMTVAQHTRFSEMLAEKLEGHAPELQPTKNLVEKLRMVKDAEELATLRHAVALTDATLAAVLPTLRPDDSEGQVAWRLECEMRERGAEGVGFDIIVAAGPNAALPHATPGDAPLGRGQPIIIDMGARSQGYHADLTRTLVIGEPEPHFWHVYNTVLAAQQTALAHIRVGMQGEAADALARTVIEAAGMGEEFGHSLGHGVGLNIHEAPSLGRTSEDTLEAGQVFSIEPGIYQAGWGGVRIEDLVLLTADGCEVLSQSPAAPVLVVPE